MSDKSKITLKWPLIDGILQQSDTTYLGPDDDKAMYIHEVYTRPDGQNTKVTKGIYSDGYRFIDMITGNKTFTLGYRPDGSINYTIPPEESKKLQKDQVPKGFDGMKIARDNIKLIPKGAKGWYATEMQTWSPEKMKLILEQYGKEGLSAAPYAYLSKRVNLPSTTKSNANTISNEDIKLLQLSLGFTGKAVDGLYGLNTIKAMKEKYGTSNIHEILNLLKTQQVNHSTKLSTPYLFDISTHNLESTDVLPSLVTKKVNSTEGQVEEKEQVLQKGVDYRGQNSWTESRFNANKENAVNTEYLPPMVAPMKNLPAVSKKNFSSDDMYFIDYKLKPLVTDAGMPDYKAIMLQHDDEYDNKYGKGQWYRNSNGEIITRKTAPNIGYNSFNVPKEWSDFIHDHQSRIGSLNESLSDNAVASYLFGDNSGFHTGTWLFGSTGRVPMYLNDEESLEDAYAKAYAAGNRRFTYGGKTYTTTSYTKDAQNYLQALYDAEFEKGKDGEISSKTLQRLNAMKAAWANDEMSRFGIDARTLGSESLSGYPVATSYNIANNIGQFGYDHGGRRMMMAANGYLDLGLNNSNENTKQSTWDKFINTFTLPGVERTTKHATPQRTALMKLGVSQALEDGSPELKKLHINTEILPLYMSVYPTNYAYTVDRVTAFDPTGNLEKKSSGNYTRTGTQIGGTMWNATEVYDPRRDITYIYDINDYGMGPNSKIGWGGYAGIPVVSMSKVLSKPKI